MIKKYETFLKIDKDHSPSPGIEIVGKLRPDVYRVDYDYNTDSVTFVTMESNHDELVDLPGTEYEAVISDVDTFLTPECQARFDAVGFLHKFNILLYGAPGTGKTCLVNRVAQKVIASGGIVLFNPTPVALKTTFTALDSIQPETRVLIIFEEMDDHVRRDEATLLHVLDGEVQKKNAMFIATTNYIDKIPARVRRPGRFSTVVEVKFPNTEARRAYLKTKLKDAAVIETIVERTNDFSIDELKEVVRGHYCMGKDLNSYISYVAKNSGKEIDQKNSDDYDDDDQGFIGDPDDLSYRQSLIGFLNKESNSMRKRR
jgi:hypothetical protein